MSETTREPGSDDGNEQVIGHCRYCRKAVPLSHEAVERLKAMNTHQYREGHRPISADEVAVCQAPSACWRSWKAEIDAKGDSEWADMRRREESRIAQDKRGKKGGLE